MSYTFLEFVDKKKRKNNEQLTIVEKLLKKNGFKTATHFESFEDDPYLFVYSPDKSIPFGIRIYCLGGENDGLAYRVQRGENMQPYGASYELDLEEMYNDIYSEIDEEEDEDEDNKDEKTDSKALKAAKKVSEALDNEIRSFFVASKRAIKHPNQPQDLGALGAVMVLGAEGGDYANKIS